MKKQSPKCDPCEERFEENIHEIVEQVEGHTCRDHEKKEKEMEKVFEHAGSDRAQQTGNSRREEESREASDDRTNTATDRSENRDANYGRREEDDRESSASDRTGWSQDTPQRGNAGAGEGSVSFRNSDDETMRGGNASSGFATSGTSERAQSAPNPHVSEESRRDPAAGTPWSHHVVGSVQDADRIAGSEITDTLERTERPEAELPR